MKEAANSLGDAMMEAFQELETVYRCGLRYLPAVIAFIALLIFMVVTL